MHAKLQYKHAFLPWGCMRLHAQHVGVPSVLCTRQYFSRQKGFSLYWMARPPAAVYCSGMYCWHTAHTGWNLCLYWRVLGRVSALHVHGHAGVQHVCLVTGGSPVFLCCEI